MASWLSRTASTQKAQLAITAVISGVVVAGTIIGYQSVRRKVRTHDLKESIPDIDEENAPQTLTEYGVASTAAAPNKEDERSAALAERAQMGDYDEDLILEQLARNRVFLKDEGLAKLRAAFVIVVGCGGVGSHATAALARSGVSKLRLIDFDQVTLSSLNRHALATLVDVGTPKVQCIRKRIGQIAPWVRFDCRNELFSESSAERQLGPWEGQKPDYVIDAIDNIDSKVALLNYCYNHSVPVVSSMGAGTKSDVTRIFIGDISSSLEDPLSRATRRRLRALGVKDGIPVVYSTEKPGPGKAELLPLPEEEFAKGGVGELGVLPEFRVRILPVLGTMPAVFGYAAANHVILEIADYPHEYIPAKTRERMYEGILGTLHGLEERIARYQGEDVIGLRLPITNEDVGYLVDEVYKGRSVVSGLPTRLVLTRWRPPEKGSMIDRRMEGQKLARLKLRDLVCMTKEEMLVHEKQVLKGGQQPEQVYDAAVCELVERRMKEEAEFERYR